jgi:hypothetical protein
VLTYARLRSLANADQWSVPFETVLARAVASGRVRRLGEGLYEAGVRRDDDRAQSPAE